MIGSSPALGSSTSRIEGSRAIARARPARFFMPPERSPGIFSKSCSSPTSLSFCFACSRIFSSGQSVCRRIGNATFSPTVIESNKAEFWNRKPMRLRTSARLRRSSAVISRPSTNTFPESGCTRPMMCLSATLLPVPLRPSRQKAFAVGMSNDTSSRTLPAPKLFVTCWRQTAGVMRPPADRKRK